MAVQRSNITLYSFSVFNPTYSKREGEEHKKILYFSPANTHIDRQIRSVGLSEAVVKFAEEFAPSRPCEAMHTQKTRQLYLNPETDFWITMTVTVPFTQRVQDGQTTLEYHEEDVQDIVFQSVLKQAYAMFKLFMGTFTDIVKKHNVEELQDRLKHFFDKYLATLRLSQSDILDVQNGIQFLPLDKNTYLRIQCFINLIEATFPQIKHTAFLYNDQLVWSGLEQDDMRILYKYISTSLFPSSLDTELKEPNSKGPSTATSHYGKYVKGPSNLKDTSASISVPRIHISVDSHTEELHLIVYRALSATVCLMVDGKTIPTLEWYRNIDSFLGPQLCTLASDIGEQYSSRKMSSGSNQEYKFVYFNHMNLAQKTTVHNRKTASATISQEILKLISDINADFSRSEEDGETLMKTVSDCWVVGKKSDQREFYVAINQKNANLIEINEEVKRMCASTSPTSSFWTEEVSAE